MDASHAVLGVTDNADRSEIRAAYRRKVLECHPDAGGDADSLKAVVRAYEALTRPAPETREEEAARLNAEMRRASEWCAERSSFGTARFGNVEMERHGASAKVVGRMKAGRFRFGGRITVYGDVSSPPWGGAHTTVVEGDTVDVRGDVLNGAEVKARDVSAVDVYGLRRTERDKVRVGVSRDASLHARITADGSVTLRHCHGPARIRGRTVDVWDIRDGCVLEARSLTVRGHTVTHDCTITVSESLAFASDHMLGLSDDCTISWDSGSVKLGRLKTYKIGRLPGFDNVPGTLVGNGFVITVEMLKHAASARGWNPFRRG